MGTQAKKAAKKPATAGPKAKAKAKPAPKTARKAPPATRARAAPPRTKRAPAQPATTGSHPKLALLAASLPPGRHADGTLIITAPDAHRAELSAWLGGRVAGRVALGRTAFGDLLVFRDLRETAAAQGLPDAEVACDVAMVDLNHKSMAVLGYSVEEFLANLDDPEFQRAYLRGPLYEEVRARLGDYADDEAYTFVPALPLGGSGEAASVQRGNWQVYQSILFQL